MSRFRTTTGLLLLSALAIGWAAPAVQADFYLVRSISLNAYFGPLGNNPFCVTFDGTYAYVGGYTAATNVSTIGILKININNPADAMALAPGGYQDVQQYRYYNAMVVKDGVLYALTDRALGDYHSNNVRAIDTATGALVSTFDGDFGDGDGIVVEPGGMSIPAYGGLAYDPGFGGSDFGLSILGAGSGKRILLNAADGTTIYTTATGMVVADITGTCTVADLSSWRDHVYDSNGNVYMRRSNQVQKAIRSGSNAISGYVHLTDALNADGTAKVDCGDGKPIALRVAAGVVGQNLALIKAGSAGTDEDIVIFNDRPNNGTNGFANAIKVVGSNGLLPATPVQLLNGDGTALTTAQTPEGYGIYDFYWDDANDLLLVLDFSARRLLVFSGTPCGTPPQDSDGDGDVDLTDFAAFGQCLSGPGHLWTAPPGDFHYCGCVDRGMDNDVDLVDFSIFQTVFGRP